MFCSEAIYHYLLWLLDTKKNLSSWGLLLTLFYLEKNWKKWTDAISTISNYIILGSYLKSWGSQKDSFTVEEKVHYGCEEGFALQGNLNRTCLKNGSWSGEAPICHFYECSDLIDSGMYHFKI